MAQLGSIINGDANGTARTAGAPAPNNSDVLAPNTADAPVLVPAPLESAPSAPSDIAIEPFEPARQVTAEVPEGWAELRENPDIQFEQIPPPPPPEPPEPNWFTEAIAAIFRFLGDLFAPVGQLFGGAWPVLQWVLLAAVILFVIAMIARNFGPLSRRARIKKQAESEPEWQPDHAQSIALLEDADKLAAAGKYDEATHLLLQRSVGQIADARPDWVEPSSTARELAALPALSDKARSAFATISERVERSLFALRSLDQRDWEAAREAYAKFALAKIDAGGSNQRTGTV